MTRSGSAISSSTVALVLALDSVYWLEFFYSLSGDPRRLGYRVCRVERLVGFTLSKACRGAWHIFALQKKLGIRDYDLLGLGPFRVSN